MSAFIITTDGISGMAQGRPYSASTSHPNYAAIIAAVKAKAFDKIHDLVNMSSVVAQQIITSTPAGSARVKVDAEAGVILFDGNEIHNSAVNRILRMLVEGFDIQPMIAFLENLLLNPSRRTIDRVWDWVEAAGMPITEDGCFIAFKRVRDDYTSFFDSKTVNRVGANVTLPRYLCDDRQEHTCSAGLHFCSQGYLPSYAGGQGRVLVLKINPTDVVAIPEEYGTFKGRACKYFVVSELEEAPRAQVETSNPLTTAVVETANIDQVAKATTDYIRNYIDGYKSGKDKMPFVDHSEDGDYPMAPDAVAGYNAGYKDGKGHKPRKFKQADLTENLVDNSNES